MPAAATIDHNTLARLVEANAVSATHVVAKPGGCGVIVRYCAIESTLSVTPSKQTRVFKRLETLVGYLKGVGIGRFVVDSDNFDAAAETLYSQPNTPATLKQAHAALTHHQWFRDQVEQAINEADDPTTQWVSNDTAMAEGAWRRAAWRAQGAFATDPRAAD